MLDTNQINQAVAVVQDVKNQVQMNWTAIAFAAALIGREVNNLDNWLMAKTEWIIDHGGIGVLIKKLLWNPNVAASRQSAADQKSST
jgi:hypothetical protein